MRRRRAIVYDDEAVILSLFKDFLSMRGYEVMTYDEPVVCPISQKEAPCTCVHPCADIVITDFKMPGMNGIELLQAQSRMGCKVAIKNKALISGYLDDAMQKQVARLGCAFFQKPADFRELAGWLTECEQRMDLSQPLGIIRKEMRYDSHREITYMVQYHNAVEMLNGIAVNMSESGLCLKIDTPLAREQTVKIQYDASEVTQTASVRWVKQTEGGYYLAGLHLLAS